MPLPSGPTFCSPRPPRIRLLRPVFALEIREVLSRFFVIDRQRAVPFEGLPIRACFQWRKTT